MKTQKATPMVNQKCYSVKDNLDNCYKIKLTYLSDKLIIDVELEDSFPQLNYSSTFNLEEIKKMMNSLNYFIHLMNQWNQ